MGLFPSALQHAPHQEDDNGTADGDDPCPYAPQGPDSAKIEGVGDEATDDRASDADDERDEHPAADFARDDFTCDEPCDEAENDPCDDTHESMVRDMAPYSAAGQPLS